MKMSTTGHPRSHAAAAYTGKDAGDNELRHVPRQTAYEASQTKDGIRKQQTRLATCSSGDPDVNCSVIPRDKPSPKMSLNLPYRGLMQHQFPVRYPRRTRTEERTHWKDVRVNM